MSYSVSIIGAGNVAWHLAPALEKAGHRVREIYNRSLRHAEQLATRLYDADILDVPDFSRSRSTVFVVAVADDAATLLLESLQIPENAIICHTSGTQPLEVLSRYPNAGVFYPLQTFSKSRPLDVSRVPFCLEASNDDTEEVLVEIAQSLSQTVYLMSSQERKVMHVGAVFACNFTNHLLALAKQILDAENLEFDLLKPLIEETFRKALTAESPALVQTGPASRGDARLIDAHVTYLAQAPHLQRIYKLLSDSILQQQNRKG